MPDQKSYYIEVDGQDPIVVDEEQFNTGKDDFYKDYPEARVSEVTSYKHGETTLDPGDAVSVNVEGQDPITLSGDKFMKGADDFYKDYPEAQVMRIRPTGTWGDNIRKQYSHQNAIDRIVGEEEYQATDEARAALAEKERRVAELRSQLDSYNKKAKAELDAIPGQNDRIIAQSKQMPKRKELEAQLKEAERSVNTDPVTLGQNAMGKKSATKGNEKLDELIAPLKEQIAKDKQEHRYMPALGGVGSVPVGVPKYEENLYLAGKNLNNEAIRTYEAPSKYQPVGGPGYNQTNKKSGFNEFMRGAGERASEADFWTMGMSGMVDQFALKGLFDKIRSEFGDMDEITDENIDEKLTPLEQEVLAAFFRNADAQARRAGDISNAYQAGRSAADSLEFMAEFALSGAVTGALGKAALKASPKSVQNFAKWIGKKLGKETPASIGKGALQVGVDAFKGFANTFFQPGTYKAMYEAMNQVDPETGKFVNQSKAAWNAIFDRGIENFSERTGDYIGNVLGFGAGAVGGKKLLDKVANTEIGKWGRAFYNSDALKMLKAGGWNGYFGEMSEEFIGAALRSATGIDPDAWKEQWDKDNIAVMAMSFLPMSIYGGTVSTVKYGVARKNLAEGQEKMPGILSNLGFSEEQIAHAMDLTQMSTPEKIRETIKPIVDVMASRGASKEDQDALMNYAIAAATVNAYDGYESEKVQQQRNATLSELQENYGDFWHENGEDERTVERVTLPDGRSGYVLDTDETGMMSVKWDDGSVSFTDAEHGAQTGIYSLDQYLDGIILTEDRAREAASMQEEEMQGRQELAQKIEANEPVPMGTDEAPVNGTYVGRDQQGNNIIQLPDGQTLLSDEELAAKWGINIQPKTEEQKEADATAEYEAMQMRKNAYNTIPRGAEVEAHLEGLDQPVKYKFTRALYDEDEQELKIFVEDENGEEKSLPESAFPDLSLAASQYSQQQEIVEEQTPAAEAQQDVPRDFRGNPLPLKADGSVNQTDLWNNDPEAWAAWNDSQRRDGGANSRNYVQAAVNTVQSEIEAAQKQYAKELDFDKREAIEKQIADKQNRLNTLNGVLSGYNAREEAAKNAVEEAAVQHEAAALAEQEMTPEQAAEAAAAEAMQIEAERQKPLEERAKAWEERTGQKVTVIHNFDEVPESEVTARASLRLGLPVTGWYSTSQGHVMLYVPNIKDESEIDKTYMHEVISHKGLREMLGKERFNELMDHTWNDIMSEADRKRFSDYVQMTWPDAEGDALRRAAADEYIANLAENIDTNPTAWEKFVAKVKEILEKILGTELKITDADLKTLLQASLARYEAQAQEGNPEISARLSDVGIASTGDETRFSVKYAPKTEAEADSIAADIAAQVGVSKAVAKRWVKSETSLADIIGTKENQPYLDYTGDDRYTAIKENSDYPQGTVDFNNICRKRLAFTDMYQRIQKAFPNVIITGEDLAKIRNIMKSHGLTVACGLCYVEDRRQLLGEIAKDFIDNYNGNFEEYAARGGEAKKKNADKFRKLIGEDRKDDLSIYDLITLSGSAKLYEEHPGIYNAFQAFNNARGQQSGNLFQGYAEYKREILKWSKARVKRVNDNGGLRVFSYSDFEAHHLIDLVQIIQDCARKGVKIQGYTKVPAFARAVSETGIKLNRSLIPLGDTGIVDGKLAYDPVEGIDVNDPNFLESNDNIGNILIGINDEQIRLAMADPFVHYIIPYHSNQREVLRSLKQTGAWTNYKPYQNEKDASGKTTLLNIYTDVIAAAEAEGKPIKTEKQFTEKFLQVCEEKGLTPRFEQFLDRKGGKYVYTPGYYKLLLDFKMFDENGKYLPQNPVVAKFDDAFNAQILNDYVKGEKEKFDGNLDDVYNEIVESLGLAGREQDVQPKTGDQILGEILESIDRKNAGQEEAQAENESEQMLFRKGDPSTEEGNTFFRINDGSLVGLHNISEEKLRKADKAGGLANPSAAVIDITKQEHNNFGEISLVMPSAMVSATSGKNGGTYLGDAWTPTFPGTQKKMSKAGSKAFDKQIMALPSDVRYNVENAFENYLEEDRDGNALRWWFLNETGRNPAIIHHESPYSEEDAKTIEGISEWEIRDEDIRTLADLYRKYASEEDVRKATTKFEPREEAKESVRKWMQEYNDEIDKYGINVTSVERFLRQAKDQIRQDGRLDDYRTMDSARQFIEDNNLGEEFRSWLEGKEEEFGVETKLFAGWDRNGYKKWLDYTAENASKLMNKESGRNAYSDNGLSATHGLLVRKMRTLAEIRKNKDLLVTRAEYDERYDQVDKELHSAISVLDGMQKISDNPFTNYDYTASRLQEALTHTNPAAYLNSEYKYSIPEDGEYAQQLEKLRRDIMEMPVNYFETKFNRPVGLSEFTSAVVPSNLDEKTRKILEDAGVTMFEYDPNQEGSRRDATMRATEQEGIRFRVANENQRIFVSNAEKAVEEMKMDKATPEQWKKTLEKNGGLKAAEDKWLGLSTWLDGLDRKTVTKQEILDFIAENQIQIEEQRYSEEAEKSYAQAISSYQKEYLQLVDEGEEAGEYNAFEYAYDQMIERYGDDFGMAFYRDGNTITPAYDYGDDLSDAAKYFLDQRREETDVRGINATRLVYTTEGLTNRQEIALTVPTIEPWNESDKIHFGDAGEGRAISWARFGDTWTSKAKDEAEKKYREADKAYRDYRNEIVAKYALKATDSKKTIDLATEEETAKAKELQMEADRLYKEWKYGQHQREKVLVLDEIQSKRHQEARDRGYKKELTDEEKQFIVSAGEEYKALTAPMKEKYGVGIVNPGNFMGWPEVTEEDRETMKKAEALRQKVEDIRKNQREGIPAAPFEKNWHELTMKRMLRYAAENGYDTVAWTTGEQQAERYSLDTVVDKVGVNPITKGEHKGERIVQLYLRNSDGDYKNLVVDEDGMIVEGDYAGQKLSAVVGMDLTTKIMGVQEGRQEFEGEDLKVGGEGMKGFYDDILPRFMNKYGKKWGVKVEDIYLPALGEDAAAGVQKGLTMHSVPVTAEMKESVMQGQTMFRITPEQDKEYIDAVESGDMEKAGKMVKDAAKAAGYDSPILYHGSDAFGFTKIDTSVSDDGASFWATNKENVAGSYTKLAVARKLGAEISDEEYEKAIEVADNALDDEILNFRSLIDKYFSEWYFGQQGNEGIRKVIMDANHVPGYGDGVYDVLEDFVVEAYRDYGEDYKEEYEDFADWEENSLEAQKIFDSISSLEGLRNQLWEIENGDLTGGIYELYANTDNMFVVDAGGKAWNELHPEGLPKIERGQYKDVPYRTRDVVKWAQENGYDGVIFKNIKDNGQYGRTEPSDVYAFLNPQSQVKSADPVTYDDNGNVIPLSERFNESNPDIRFRITPEQDAEYLKAVEAMKDSGLSLEEHRAAVHDVQSMLSDAFMRRMGTALIDEKGDPIVMWHTTDAEFSVFDKSRLGEHTDHSATDENYAKTSHIGFWTNTQSYLSDRMGFAIGGNSMPLFVETHNPLKFESLEDLAAELGAYDSGKAFAEAMKNRGYDSVIIDDEEFGGVSCCAFDANQLKSAELVTYDDNGNVIPLSERFNEGNDDIRFRVAPMNEAEAEESVIRFRVVDDPLKIAELEAKPKVKVYRSMQEIDGKLYPPMSARVDGELRQPTELGVWEESEENPALADENGDFKLDKGNGKSLKAAYAPYFHSRRSPLNEQFSEAYNRPNLVIVEGEIPESELTSGYIAEKSKKSVGEHDWPSGKVSNALAKKGQDTRKVILSRWFKPVRVVPNSEVADMIMERMGDSDIAFPYNVVTPSLREELAKRGARFDGWQGNKPENVDEQIARMEAENKQNADNTRFRVGDRNPGESTFDYMTRLHDAYEQKANEVVPIVIMESSHPDAKSLMDIFNIKDDVVAEEFAYALEKMFSGVFVGAYSPLVKKIIIFGSTSQAFTEPQYDRLCIHESIHGIDHKNGWDYASTAGKELLDKKDNDVRLKAIYDKLLPFYPETNWTREMLAYAVAGGIQRGDMEEMMENAGLEESNRDIIRKIANEINYDDGRANGDTDREVSGPEMAGDGTNEKLSGNAPDRVYRRPAGRDKANGRGRAEEPALARIDRTGSAEEGSGERVTRFRLAEQDTAGDLVNQYDNQDGEEFPWMSERELMDRVQEEIPYGKDSEKLYALIDRYNRLDEADLEEGRRDYSGSEKDDVFEEFLDALRQFADGEDHTLFKLGEQGEKPVRTADDLVKRVQDYGLRGILDEDAAKAFWADAYAVMPEDARREIIDATFGKDADKQDLDIRRQTRAYVADLAKKGYAEDESGLLRYLADKLKEELGQDLDENTLRYLIWRSAKRYASNNLLDLAEDIAIRRRLGVGEFNGEKFPTGTSEAMDEAEKRIDEAESERDEARQATRRQARKTPYAALNSAMTAQRKYDQETVASVVALAKDMIKKGNIDKVSAREMARLMTIIKDANGRKPATVKAATLQLLDFMVDHTIGKERELLDKVVKVRTAKVREPGVDTIAKLDLRAQNVVNSFRENYKLSEEEILRNISELEDKMADGRRTDASLEDMRSQLEGLNLALQYATEIGAKEADIRAIRQQMKDAKDEFDALSAEEKKKFRTSLNEELAAGEEMIRSKKIEEVDAYRRLRGDIAGAIDEGAERAKTFLEAERERVEQIHHWANSDMQGVSADVRDRNLTGWGKFANSSFAKLFTAPLANLDQMLRTLGRKTPEGRGYLWNWMMGAVRKASDDEKLGLDAAEKKLNDKVKEIFDDPKMEWNDLYSLERKMPKSKMTYFSANGEWVTEELTQGNLLYIYMVNKMTDGRMKLRQMNITEEDVQEIKKALDPRFVELADWVQEEFLPGLRDRYNETHKRLFGTSMASIENYFPLRILGGVIEEKRNVGDQEGKALPTDITGAIIKRTVNSKQLNLAGTDALSLVVEHLREMEHWNAYAEASRDFSTLLKYKRFQNQLKQLDTVYGAGKDLLDLFWDTVNLSVGAFRPKTTPTDKAFLNLAKGVTAAKISFRAYTAIKQILSWPAFLADTNPLILAKNTLPINWKKNWDWAMENLPNFKKRVESRKAGLDILEDTSLDSKFWGTDFAKWINQNGMFMNAFVDALTVSIGAKSVYETKKARYIEEGFSEEEADKKAKYDAEVAYNETQQSSEKEFMSTMQAHRTVANVALSAYRNSSMGYQRQLHQALRTLNRMSRKGYKHESIEFMTKQLEREGLSEADAKKAAEDRYKRASYQAAVRVAVFGWLVQFAWNLGAHAVYLLFGDDPDEKKAMLREDATHALVGGPIEGLAAGNIMSEAFNMIKNGENLRNWDPTTLPIMSDIKSTISKMSSDPVAGANDLVYLAAQIGLGTNPQTLSDAIVAIVDACNGDFETAREVMFCIMRILAVPQSQLDQLMIDEIGMKAKDARELSYEDVAKRYVDYKMKRNAPLTGPLYSDELREKREKSLLNTSPSSFKNKVKERKKLKGEE